MLPDPEDDLADPLEDDTSDLELTVKNAHSLEGESEIMFHVEQGRIYTR